MFHRGVVAMDSGSDVEDRAKKFETMVSEKKTHFVRAYVELFSEDQLRDILDSVRRVDDSVRRSKVPGGAFIRYLRNMKWSWYDLEKDKRSSFDAKIETESWLSNQKRITRERVWRVPASTDDGIADWDERWYRLRSLFEEKWESMKTKDSGAFEAVYVLSGEFFYEKERVRRRKVQRRRRVASEIHDPAKFRSE